jgi:hypothetical protein
MRPTSIFGIEVVIWDCGYYTDAGVCVGCKSCCDGVDVLMEVQIPDNVEVVPELATVAQPCFICLDLISPAFSLRLLS